MLQSTEVESLKLISIKKQKVLNVTGETMQKHIKP